MGSGSSSVQNVSNSSVVPKPALKQETKQTAPLTNTIQTKPLSSIIPTRSARTATEQQLNQLPSGYIKIHGGLKLSNTNDDHSSPLLVINLYKDEDATDQTNSIDGIIHQNEVVNTEAKSHQKVVERYINCTEELKIIPVEDVVNIRYKSQFRKAIYREERVDKAEEMEIKRGLFSNKKEVKEVAHTTTREAQDAKRLITIEIEYYEYANPDSASIIRALSKEEREREIRKYLKTTTLKFNLINNKEFESNDYHEKQKQAELLCRTVAHLKTLRVYPSVQALPNMIYQDSLETLGHVFVERDLNAPSLPALPSTQVKERLAIESS